MGRHRLRKATVLFVCGLAAAASWSDDAPILVDEAMPVIIERLRTTLDREALLGMTRESALAALTADEREILATGHIQFTVDRPATVWLVRDADKPHRPFWLAERGFSPTELTLEEYGENFDVWRKDVEAGHVSLGVNSVAGGGHHYFLAVTARDGGTPGIEVLHPAYLEVTDLAPGVRPYVDMAEIISSVPEPLVGARLIRTAWDARDDARLSKLFSETAYPAGSAPDQVMLTWGGDPATTQSIQWRTATTVPKCTLTYRRADATDVSAETSLVVTPVPLETPNVLNDPAVHRYEVVLEGLAPGTEYEYAVAAGEGRPAGWRRFTTAPAGSRDFAFVYMGDVQNGIDLWGSLMESVLEARPDAAFHLVAGDLVNRGYRRDEWDAFLWHGRKVYGQTPLLPAIGNHEVYGGGPRLYLALFDLPTNGPPALESERAYSLEYGDALIVVLDTNVDPEQQVDWLDERLAASRARWKLVSLHHPVFSARPVRDNVDLREQFLPVLDRHNVDLVLQGHDHSYLRTHPLRHGAPTGDEGRGTIFVISVAGAKMYAQEDRAIVATGFTDVSTWQVIDIEAVGRLTYRAYDAEGELRDEFVIDKSDR